MRRTSVAIAVVALVGLLAAGVAAQLLPEDAPRLPGPRLPALRLPGDEPAAEPVEFLAWGDAGHGSPEQRATAEAARRVCEQVGCDLALHLGDNVYDNGVASVDDPQLREKFEAPYENLSIPFYMVLGNHDVRGNATAQVAYTNASDKWEMPARDYAFRRGDVLFVGLDLTKLDEGDASQAAQLGAWVDETLSDDARWRVAFSHFPYASGGQHGNGSAELRAFLERHVCGRVDLYLAGHDHDLQWLREQPSCRGTELVVSGAASKARPLGETRVDAHFALGGRTGYFWFRAEEERLVGRAYASDGEMLFERAVVKEARAAASSTPPPRSSGT